jgi:hypothetical protein
MVEEVTTYRTIDGKEFYSRQTADEHEAAIMAARKPLVELMRERVRPEYQGPLLTFEEMLAQNGWAEGESPTCCGEKLRTENWLGATSQAECSVCGKWALNVAAPSFVSSGAVGFPDIAKYDLDDPRQWLAGQPS